MPGENFSANLILTPICVECSDSERAEQAVKVEAESIPRRPGREDPPPSDQDSDDYGYLGAPRNPIKRKQTSFSTGCDQGKIVKYNARCPALLV
eukprot:1812889-Amphidinium_carterae.1